jgi:hypothetical protein
MQHLRPVGEQPDAVLLEPPEKGKGKSKEIIFGEKVYLSVSQINLAWPS